MKVTVILQGALGRGAWGEAAAGTQIGAHAVPAKPQHQRLAACWPPVPPFQHALLFALII